MGEKITSFMLALRLPKITRRGKGKEKKKKEKEKEKTIYTHHIYGTYVFYGGCSRGYLLGPPA